MSSLQEAALDQIISTCPDDILIKCHQRIVEKLNKNKATIIINIDPTIGDYLYLRNDDCSEKEKTVMKLFIQFTINLLDNIKLINDRFMHWFMEEVANKDFESCTSYKDILIHILDNFEDFDYTHYIEYVVYPVRNQFKLVLSQEETEIATQLLNEFIDEHNIPDDLNFNKVFKYHTGNLFDQVVTMLDDDTDIETHLVNGDDAFYWHETKIHLYHII